MSFHFRWTHPPLGISQNPPMKQIDILSNISKRIPQNYPLEFISEQMILVTEYIWFSKMESVETSSLLLSFIKNCNVIPDSPDWDRRKLVSSCYPHLIEF